MAEKSPKPALIIAALLIVMGIIHFGVGVGIVARYRQYGNVFQQSVGLCAFNIVIGIFTVAVAIVGLISILTNRGALSEWRFNFRWNHFIDHDVLGKVVAIMSAVLAVITIASLIAALVINSQSISYVRNRLAQNMNAYVQDQSAIDMTDRIQTKYQCCGVNLWLDWARISLGVSIGTGAGTSMSQTSLEPEDLIVFLFLR